jgi:hypothetical protein
MKINLRLFTILVVLAFTVMACQIGSSTAGISGETGEILFQDNFHDNSVGWYTYVDANGITDYENDGFRIDINETNAYYWTNPNPSITNTIIEVEATKLSGPEENDFGNICRYQDENNFYFFTISSDGYYGITKIVGGAEF